MMPLMKINSFSRCLLSLPLALFALLPAAPASAQKEKKQKGEQIVKPVAGPRAAALRTTWIYVSPSREAQKVDRVAPGREMVIAERSGGWLRVFANTDIQEIHNSDDEPWVGGGDQVTPPISGWIEARGIVEENTPNGDQILMGEAANEESEASDPRGPANAAQTARLLYRRLVEIYPNSPLAAEAAWRAADIQWQIQKADVQSRPSAKERDAYLRAQINEDEMKKVIKYFPHTRPADMAAFALLDNKLCGDWQGQEKCPEKETELYEKYAAEHPDGPRTAQALYNAVYRQCVLVDMAHADQNDKKADAAKARAHDLVARLHDKFPQSDYTPRATALVFKIDQNVPVYGIDQQ
jgi:outer membrane protein assembly factor BamD (BamD/ComL family)